jgi:hypothetical protein
MTLVRDDYPKYFAEKLWEWLPPVYRDLDQLEGGSALRAFVEALADQAALLKRSQDRLWDDAFVELASDWALPYLGELVGTRLVSALNPRGRRADIAKTIYYRRRKGTLAVLEQLIEDICGWDGKVVEEFRRLARMRHGLDGPARLGSVTGTPEGGLADLRSHRGRGLVGGPFDEFHYTPDIRQARGSLGRRGIPKLSFHLYRLQAVAFHGVHPRRMKSLAGSHQGFTFDPSGRDIPLFSPGRAGLDGASWHSADPWALPRALDCCLLDEAIHEVGPLEEAWVLDEGPSGAPIATLAQRKAAAADLRRLAGQRFSSPGRLRFVLSGMPSAATLTQPGILAGLLSRSLVADCGSAALLPGDEGLASHGAPALDLRFQGTPGLLPRKRTRAGDLELWNLAVPTGVDWVVDPGRGRFLVNPAAHALASVRVHYHLGMLAPLGAGAFGRELAPFTPTQTWQDGTLGAVPGPLERILIPDSATYLNPADFAAVQSVSVQAAEEQRPYVRLTSFWHFASGKPGAELRLDGLWIGTQTESRALVLEGSGTNDFAEVILRTCTLDPGGEDAIGTALPPVYLLIDGHVDRLVIEGCILSSIQIKNAQSSVDHLILRDSILHARIGGTVPIHLPTCSLEMERCTVLAPELDDPAIVVERLEASECLIAGIVQVSDRQSGCFRFSARAAGSLVPRPYRCCLVEDLSRVFASRRFGDPDYLQLAPCAPAEIARGGEHGGEMGCYAQAALALKQEGLAAKLDEYMPFGRVANLMFEN